VTQRRSRKGKDRTRRRTRPTEEPPPAPEGLPQEPSEPQDQELMQSIAAALDDRHPLALLDLISAVTSAVDPRRRDPFDQADENVATIDEVVESFLGVGLEQTSAALAVVAATTEDEVLRARIRRELAARQHPLPAWLRNLAFEVTQVVEMTHVLGDGDDIILGVRLPSGYEFSLLVYIDHNVGTLVKDAFSIDQPVDGLLAKMRSGLLNEDQRVDPLDPADARARIEEAIEQGARTYPPFESDSWPGSRPLVEWVVRTLPLGGTGYVRPEWSENDVQALADDFFASEYGRPVDSEDGRGLLDNLLWFGTGYGPGDPLRWSPVAVEIVLEDWIPRKVMADVEYLSQAPDVLRAFVRYCHDRRGIRAGLTADTLQAIDRWEPGYQKAIRGPREQGPMAVLERMGALGQLSDPDAVLGDDSVVPAFMLEMLGRAVGGEAELDRLDTQPLPDEPFGWEQLPGDIGGRVAEVLALCDAFCDAHMDVEFRTACRRFLSDVAARDPVIFRRKGAANRAAAAVCWVVGKANNAIGGYGLMEVRELEAHFGVTGGVSQRAQVMLEAVGVVQRSQLFGMDLGTPRYLTSRRRGEIVAQRAAQRARMAD
jgi:Domain of unknown function (DUF6398)